jgi:cell division protein FtsL
MRRTTILTLIVAAGMGVAMFYLKYRVADLEGELTHLNRAIIADRQAIHVLDAEWSHLNDTERLRALAERHLGMVPAGADEFVEPQDIPMAPAHLATTARTDDHADRKSGAKR